MTEQMGLSLVISGLDKVPFSPTDRAGISFAICSCRCLSLTEPPLKKSKKPHMSVEPLSPRLESLVQQTRALLEQAVGDYQDVVYSNSLGAEAMVLTDILCTHAPEIGM